MSGGDNVEYTVQKLSAIAGVSTRTLRYYDEIGILKPARINSSGYRIYTRAEVDILQQILFYREMGVTLENIKEIITEPSFNKSEALNEHHRKLLEKREQLDILILNVEKTIASMKGDIKVSDKEKFEGFKRKLVEENEEKYGSEARQKYGDEAVEKSNAKLMGMSEEKYKEISNLAEEIMLTLAKAFKTGDPGSELAQKTADLHKRWLTFYWDSYSKEAHAGIVEMYVMDERFKAYYDKDQPGMAEFLRDAVLIYTGMNEK